MKAPLNFDGLGLVFLPRKALEMNKEIEKFLEAALECSVFVSPKDPGLSDEELLEAGKEAGYYDGEVQDAAANFRANPRSGRSRILPRAHLSWWAFVPEDPEYRNFDAFDFVIQELNERVRHDGVDRAQLDRSDLVARALEKEIPQHDIEVAITYQVLA